MQIVQTLAGYSLGRADIIRRAMGKKKLEIMEEEKQYFINGKLDDKGNVEVPGCIRNGISKYIAEKIWEQMAHFSSYAFNKSHSAVYAMLGAYTAWLKKYYPSIFMAETMNIFNSDTDKLNMYLHVTAEMGIKILPPNLNSSNKEFSSNGKDILFGLGAIKYMGQNSDFIMEERQKRGEFKSYQDLVVRMVRHQQTNKRAFEGLIYSGALDTFEGTRRAKMEYLPNLVSNRKEEVKRNISGQVFMGEIESLASQFENIDILPEKEEYIKEFKLEKEKEYAGFYVTEHPLDDYMKYFKNSNIAKIGEVINSSGENEEGEFFNLEYYDGVGIKVAGIIRDKKTYYTKKGDPLFAFEIEGKTGTIKSVMFNNQIELMGEKVMEGNVVIVEGALKIDDFGFQIIANNVVDITRLKDTHSENQAVKITAISKEQLDEFNSVILRDKSSLGDVPVYVSFKGQNLRASQDIDLNFTVVSKLDNIFADNYQVIQR